MKDKTGDEGSENKSKCPGMDDAGTDNTGADDGKAGTDNDVYTGSVFTGLMDSGSYAVDNTRFIADIIDHGIGINMLTSPAGYGKSVNLSMLAAFFAKTGRRAVNKKYFKDTDIWAFGAKYRKFQDTCPVIYVSFKDTCRETWQDTYEAMCSAISAACAMYPKAPYSRGSELYSRICGDIINGKGSQTDFETSLKALSSLLCHMYGTAPIAFIEDYDTPLLAGIKYGYYSKVQNFMGMFLSRSLKSNECIHDAFVTGVLPFDTANMTATLNNINVYTVLDSRYSEYFGICGEDMRDMLEHYGCTEKYSELLRWYGCRYLPVSREAGTPVSAGTVKNAVTWKDNGSGSGNADDTDAVDCTDAEDVFASYSVIRCLQSGCEFKGYRAERGKEALLEGIIDDLLERISASDNTRSGWDADTLCELLDGRFISMCLEDRVSYNSAKDIKEDIWTWLAHAGYICAVQNDGRKKWKVCIPNIETRDIFVQKIREEAAHGKHLPEKVLRAAGVTDI